MSDVTENDLKKFANSSELDLSALLNCAKIFGIGDLGLDDDMSMRDTKLVIENRILNEIHPYSIFYMESTGQWTTHLPDPTKKGGRRLIRRNSRERLNQAVIEFYRDKLNTDKKMSELFDEWLIFRRDETVAKPATIRKDVSVWKTHIRSVEIDGKTVAEYKVSDITPKLLYRFFRKITKDRSYSRQSVNNIKGVFSGLFAYAVELDIIQSNPVRDVDLKRLTYKPHKDKREDVYSIEDAQRLLAYLEGNDDPYALAIRLDFNLFARVGEIAGLMWENVDLDKRCIYLCHQITYEPKLNDDLTFSDKVMVTEEYMKGCTSHGYRTEYLTDDAVEILKKARKINPNGKYVFMPFGKPIITTTFNKRLKRYCEEAKVPYHSSHKIRFCDKTVHRTVFLHAKAYAASVAYDGDNLTSISQMMGHSQISTTMHYLRDVIQNDDHTDVFKNLGRQR